MANRLLRNIAVSIGAGLATGFGRRLASRPVCRPAIDRYPILTRLEDIESRVSRVELAPLQLAAPTPEEIEALGTLVSAQSEDIASLRQDLLRIERRNVEQMDAFGQKVASLEQQVPAHIETSVAARMNELEQRLREEFQAMHHRTVDAFAETIEKRVVGRIATLENNLFEQSQSIASLREKSLQTDGHLQRLLDAVEKLCVKAETQSQITLLQLEQQAPEPEASAPEQPETQHAFASQALLQDHLAQPHQPVPAPEIELEPELAFAGAGRSDPRSAPAPRRGFRPFGMAILGLAIIGFRLIR
jgi:hypothetical protein